MGTNSIDDGTFNGPVFQAGTINLARRQIRPFGLPARSVFVGREKQLADLDEALSADGELVMVSALSGMGGVGKTALAVEAAYRAQDRFPGGILFIDLRGYDETRLSPDQALDTLLHALGETAPPGLVAKEQLYRSCLAALPAPLLLVADNASSANQITPLLPGDPRHRVLVTSRHMLADRSLTPRHLSLDVLSEPEAVALLTELHSPDPAFADLARLCGCLPLALRIAAALLADRSPAELAADLTDSRERLAELDYGPDFAIRATFDLSYRHLAPEEARLFALLARSPGSDFGLPAATALADRTERKTARLLRNLTRAHLLNHSGGRHSFHDLVRLYAVGCPADDAPRSVQRIVSYYVDTAADIRRTQANPRLPGLAGWRATQWLRDEMENVRAAWAVSGHQATTVETASIAHQLTAELVVVISSEVVRYAVTGIRSPTPVDVMVKVLTTMAARTGLYPEIPHASAVADAIEQGIVLCRTAEAVRQQAPPRAAILLSEMVHCLLALRAVCRQLDEPGLVGKVSILLGTVRTQLGQFEQAAAEHHAAITVFESVSESEMATIARSFLTNLTSKGATEER